MLYSSIERVVKQNLASSCYFRLDADRPPDSSFLTSFGPPPPPPPGLSNPVCSFRLSVFISTTLSSGFPSLGVLAGEQNGTSERDVPGTGGRVTRRD